MATDTELLMGEMIENPEGQLRNVEQLLVDFLHALVAEQQPAATPKDAK